MSPEEWQFAARSFDDLLRNPPSVLGAAEFLDVFSEVPSGQYVCGCDWSGGIIPHYCPKHHQPPIFVIQGERQ
jgi:hypothetical protein